MEILEVQGIGSIGPEKLQRVSISLKAVYDEKISTAASLGCTPNQKRFCCALYQGTAGSMQWSAPAAVTPQRDRYTPYMTEEGVTVQTLVPPMQDAAEAVAGRLRRARAAVAARTRQMHGPLPMPPRKIPPRPRSPSSKTLSGQYPLFLKSDQGHLPASSSASQDMFTSKCSFRLQLTMYIVCI